MESAERRPVTIKNYLCDLKYFEKWFEQKTEQKLTPERITPTDLRDYKHFLSEVLSLKPKTVNRKLSSLKSFLNWALCEELIPEHRTPRIPKPIKEEKVGPQWLERNEQHNLVRMVEQGQNQRDITIIQLLLNTGLRVSELCGLMWSDLKITSRKGRLTVRSGKGGKRREIPLNKDARKVLKDLGYSNQKGKFEAIFMGQRGPMTPRLEKDEKTGRTPITWLRHHATTNSPNSILNALEKLTFLEKQNVPSWDLSCLNPNRIKFLAQLGKKSRNQALQRSNDEKRYPI